MARSLSAAQRSLLHARQLLSGDGGSTPAGLLTAAEPPPQPWHDFLHALTFDQAARLLALLSEAVRQSRLAIEAVVADAEVEHIRLHLLGATASFAEARHLMAERLAS